MNVGTRVRFTIDNVGVVADVSQRGFSEPVAHRGQEGVVVDRHPQVDGWLWVQVTIDGSEFYAPVHADMVEPVIPGFQAAPTLDVPGSPTWKQPGGAS